MLGLLVCNTSIAQDAGSGQDIGLPFMGIQAKSNGPDTGKPEGDLDWQCVQLTRNFAIGYHNGNFVAPVTCAANM